MQVLPDGPPFRAESREDDVLGPNKVDGALKHDRRQRGYHPRQGIRRPKMNAKPG
jgi:hypothetical protein